MYHWPVWTSSPQLMKYYYCKATYYKNIYIYTTDKGQCEHSGLFRERVKSRFFVLFWLISFCVDSSAAIRFFGGKWRLSFRICGLLSINSILHQSANWKHTHHFMIFSHVYEMFCKLWSFDSHPYRKSDRVCMKHGVVDSFAFQYMILLV